MENSDIVLYSILTSLLWGITNPLIKKSTKDIVTINDRNYLSRFLHELQYLITNWKYMLFFCLNQSGSVLFIILLQNVDLSLVVPAVNSLTFLVTAVTGIVFKEHHPTLRSCLGVILIVLGVLLCLLDKVFIETLEK